MYCPGDPRGFLLRALVLPLAVAVAAAAHAQEQEERAPRNVGIGGTNSIIPSIFTHARPAVTVTIKVDALATEYRKGIKLVNFNSIGGYDERPENHHGYVASCEAFFYELYLAKIDAESVSTSFAMQGYSNPWIDDAICGVEVYERPPSGSEGDSVFFLFHALSGDEPELDGLPGLDLPGDGRSRTVDVSVSSFGDYHNVGIHHQNFGRVVEIEVAPDAPSACSGIGSGMTIPQFPTRGHADEYVWNITAPRVARGSPVLVCRIRAVTHWEGRVVKEAYDTVTFFGASDSGGGCTIEDLGMLSGAGVTREGYWRSDCVSPNYVGEYARYYSFVLTRARDVRIDLESPSVDTWLDLRQGAGTSGTVVETDNDGGTGTNALIDTRLDAGTYTIEATTLRTARSGPFTLTVRTSGDGSDRAALVALYEETNGSGWTNRTNWLSREPLSEWYGVSTNADGRVIEIDLDGNGLSGSIPGALRDIASLERLDLGPQPPDTPSGQPLFNMLTGPIPPELGSLTNLVFLDLGFNELSGPIPRELGSLVNLESLFLPDNRLSGQIPLELANLAKLEKLYLNKNTLTGPIPEWLGTLTNLRWLILGGSGLTGPVPRQLGNLADLERLGLWRLGLTGPMPLWLGTMGSLRSLSLSRNELTGGIPPELGDLVNLESLFLYENPLTGPVPRSLTQLSLGYFWIHATGACVPADTTFRHGSQRLRTSAVTSADRALATLPIIPSFVELRQSGQCTSGNFVNGSRLCAHVRAWQSCSGRIRR